MRVVAAAGSGYRFQLPDGGTGLIAERDVAPVGSSIGRVVLADTTPVLAHPDHGSPRLPVPVSGPTSLLGRFGGFGLIAVGPGL